MSVQYPSQFARFYDLIYHHLRDGVDNTWFLEQIKNTNGKVLEIGVGTGRFFIEALHNGADIYGIDVSESMINILKNKLDPDHHHRISLQDMVNFNFDTTFDLIIAPFRVIMHILNKNDQLLALNNVFKHLNPGGTFIFDTFIPDLNYLISGLKDHKDFEGEYKPGKLLRRYATTYPDLINQLIHVHFKLEWDEEEGVGIEESDIPLRFFFRYELEHLVERSDFGSYRIYGDYQENPLGESSKEFVVVCKK